MKLNFKTEVFTLLMNKARREGIPPAALIEKIVETVLNEEANKNANPDTKER